MPSFAGFTWNMSTVCFERRETLCLAACLVSRTGAAQVKLIRMEPMELQRYFKISNSPLTEPQFAWHQVSNAGPCICIEFNFGVF